ncbi:chromosome segregation protein SMC [Eubacterium sp. AF17-7]|uniref:chromosome segregation protein SMC n=1 Tax=Eubacterium sp. AF17-7 TaxID=2293105 RepID=UPI000E4998C3|nr:chromosome segregation protein SMC [Eubacterium sp. AF17-7]RGG66717.1 chromosome segregation protein SMC [Eubacterium sp. AF17-7]
MYLKSIEIHGFKSFANKIKFEFHNGITGIVGPNGSGKSNVADAVRWVLGEQKVKQLRGSKMEDVIFAGTENRKPLGFAYVAITLDNSDHKLDVDYEEVTVSRRLFRSGESEYMINGTQVRLKDVNELFYDTGIGKEGYSIIGQGQIDQILSGKPEERRELFDEAAGIVKFKRRKNQALKKLDDENQNLVRVQDILAELERQVGPLEKQCEKAKKYLLFKDDLKKYDVNMFLVEMEDIKNRLSDLDKKLEIATSDMNSSNEEFENIKKQYTKLEADLEEINNSIEAKKTMSTDTVLKIEKLEGRILVLKEQINSAKNNEEFIATRVNAISSDIAKKEKNLTELCKEKDDNENVIQETIKSQSEITTDISVIKEEIENFDKEIAEHKAEIIEILNSKSMIKSKLQRCDTLLEQINIRKSQLNQKLIEFQSEKENQESKIEKLKAELDKVNDLIDELNKTVSEYRNDLNDLRVENSKITKSISENQERYHKSKSNLEALKNITERYEGYGNSIKKVMELKENKKGIIGVVADIIKVEKKYEVAIETALGGNIQNIVTDTETTAKEIIEYLKKNKYGRATFLPLSSMTKKTGFNNEDVFSDKGVLGLACDLVEIKKEYEGVTKYLLGKVVVVDTIDNAIALERKYRYSLRIVTLEGEYLNIGGSISGGAFKNNSNLLGRRREIEELENKLKDLKNEKENLDKNLIENRSKTSVLNDELDKINKALQEQNIAKNTLELNLKQAKDRKNNIDTEYQEYTAESGNIASEIGNINNNSLELNKELTNVEDRNSELEELIKQKSNNMDSINAKLVEKTSLLEEINIEISSLKQKHEFLCEKIQNSNNQISDLKNELEQIKNNSSENNNEISARIETIDGITKEIEEGRKLIEKLNLEIEDLKNAKEKQNKDHKEFFDKREELSSRITQLDKEIYRLNSQKENLQEKNETKINYMWNEYEITYRNAVELRDESLNDKAELRNSIANLKRQIKELGDVNVNAIEEFKEINERYQFMKEQHEDLMRAKENLLKIIDELEVGMRKQFKEKFAEIQVEFDKVFKELFGGGAGVIELTEADDILDAGINIISQPPGKKLQNMMQLSGGEKALTAICLLFAIQNLKPSPFCLLDEIEAALDGSNVIRFAEYLHKLTENTQFIVVTHRRGTMGCADRLYGITMQEKGVSALVSVDLLEGNLDK